MLQQGIDKSGSVSPVDFNTAFHKITSEPEDLASANFFVVTAPTPIDKNHRPDLNPLIKAAQIIGKFLQPGSVVVYESTVYPGITEEICGAILAEVSSLQHPRDFQLGYSPERINPGDAEHTLQKIVKVVAGEDAETLERVARVYEQIIDAGVYHPVADPEAAKHEYGIKLANWDQFADLDALVLAVTHQQYLKLQLELLHCLRTGGILMDVKSVFDPAKLPPNIVYWSL